MDTLGERSGREDGVVRFWYGPMSSGKSALALQHHHNLTGVGRTVDVWTFGDRSGGEAVTSRVGMSVPARNVADLSSWEVLLVCEELGEALDCLIVDEAQFADPLTVEIVCYAADRFGWSVDAYGLLTNFRQRLFAGSATWIELADEHKSLPAVARCWCGRAAVSNARVVSGRRVLEGPEVAVGDVGGEGDSYMPLCRPHFRQGLVATPA